MLAAVITAYGVQAQVAINTDGSAPNASAMLHVKSTTKGVIISSMTSTQRDNISSPANGLLVYDTNTKSFWYFKSGGAGWTEIGTGLDYPINDVENDASNLYTLTNDGDGSSFVGVNNTTTSSISAVRGEVSSTAPGGFSSAVRGLNAGTGGLGIGMWGSQAGSGWGVYGVTPNGLGVYGNSSASGTGVYANSNSGTGLTATSTNGIPANIAIFNNANNNNALVLSTLGNGDVVDVSTTGNGIGVLSSASNNHGVQGITAVQSGAGILGDNNGNGEAVVGRTTSDIAGAVVGRNDGGGYGVYGFINTNTSGDGVGVYGRVGGNSATGHAGKFQNTNTSNNENIVEVDGGGLGNGIYAEISGSTTSNAAINGVSTYASGNGIIGRADGTGAFGIWGKSTNGYAGYFSGPVYVGGTLSKSAGTFKIDHPQDPANKYLIHSFVESPDMMNVYNGNATTDANGTTVVTLPAYFEAENIDFKYQLTVMGQQFARAIVSREVSNNQFEIRTDKPNVKVSWQVTGIRNDKFAQQNRVVAEVDKAANEKGFYLNAKENGQPENRSMEYAYGKIAPEKPVRKASEANNAAAAKLPSAQPAKAVIPVKRTIPAMPSQEAQPSGSNTISK